MITKYPKADFIHRHDVHLYYNILCSRYKTLSSC